MFSKFFKNINIRKKIFFAFLGLLIITQFFMASLLYISVIRINNYSSNEMINLSENVSEIGQTSLKSQSEYYLKSLSFSNSKNVEKILSEISDQVISSCVGIEKVYENKSNLKNNIVLLPEIKLKNQSDEAFPKAYAIDISSKNNETPLVYYLPDYDLNTDVYKTDINSWNSFSDSKKKEIIEKNIVVSKNSMPQEIYNELLKISGLEYVFEPIYKGNSCISNIYLGTENGIFYKYSKDNSSQRYDPRNRQWYKTAIESASKNIDLPVWQNTYISKTTGKFCITCSKAFKDKNGKILGVCAIDTYIDDIANLITRYNKIGNNGYSFIIDEKGSMIMHPEYTSFFENQNSLKNSNIENSELIKKILENKEGIITSEINKCNYVVSYTPMSANNWILVSLAEEKEIMQPISNIQSLISENLEKSENNLKNDFAIISFIILITLIIVFILVNFICLKISKSLSEPIANLSKKAQKIGKGDFSCEIAVNSQDEIGMLAESFNLMVKNLKKYMIELEKTIAEKEKVHSELMIANKIQRSMLPYIFPAFPERKDFDIYAVMDPAKEIGGDFYDFFFIDENKFALVIADVSGKGVSAALFMVIAKILIKNELQNKNSPADVLEIVNNRLCENNEAEMFVTSFLGILDIKTGKFVFANAGHNPPFIYEKEKNKCRVITHPHGFVLGAMKNLKYRQEEFYLNSGDFLFLYTDGVTEAANKQGKLFSQSKLEKVLTNSVSKNLTIQEIIKNLQSEIEKFANGAEQTDDITMLAFKNFTIVPFKPKKFDENKK